MIKMEIIGLRELQKMLQELPENVERRVIRKALSRAMTPATRAIRNATYTTVQRRSGLLRAGLKARVIKARQREEGRIAAGVFTATAKAFIAKLRKAGKVRKYISKGRKTRGQVSDITVPFYWKFIERGTSKFKAAPYVERAFEAATPQVLDAFKAAVATGIEREWKK